MSSAVAAAAVDSAAPTLASRLPYSNAHSTRRQATGQARAGPVGRVLALATTAPRTEAGLARVEAGVGELAEREGHLEGRLPGPAVPGRAAP